MNDQLFFIKYETFRKKPDKTMEEVLTFLGQDNGSLKLKKGESHSGTYKSDMDKVDRAWLRDYFAHDIQEVQKLLGWDCSD